MSLMHANYMFLSIYIMPRIETELFALVLFLRCRCKLLLLCYSLFISTCSKINLISWLCIPTRPCTSITWNLTPQEEVVIMAERLILDLNFKWNPVMHKICTWCWCSFLHPARLFQWYLTCCVDTISTCQTGSSCVEMEKCVLFLHLFYFCLNLGLFIKLDCCIVSFRDIGVVQWVNHMKTLYLHGWSHLMIYSCHQSLCTSLKRQTAVEIRSLQIKLSSCAKILCFEVDL